MFWIQISVTAGSSLTQRPSLAITGRNEQRTGRCWKTRGFCAGGKGRRHRLYRAIAGEWDPRPNDDVGHLVTSVGIIVDFGGWPRRRQLRACLEIARAGLVQLRSQLSVELWAALGKASIQPDLPVFNSIEAATWEPPSVLPRRLLDRGMRLPI